MDDDNYRLDRTECGDVTGEYYQCYLYENCEGVTSQHWYDCYGWDANCELYNGCTNYYCINTIDPTFFEFAECYEETSLDDYECTDQDNYDKLYRQRY